MYGGTHVKKWFYIFGLSVFVAGLPTSVTRAAAQAKQASKPGGKPQIPRMPDGKPDLTGVWAGPGFKFTEKSKFPEINIGAGGIARNLPPLVAGGEELFNLKKNGEVRHDDPQL